MSEIGTKGTQDYERDMRDGLRGAEETHYSTRGLRDPLRFLKTGGQRPERV